MSNLLKCELNKLKKSKNLKISLAIILVLVIYTIFHNNPDSLEPEKNVMLLPLFIFSSFTAFIAIMSAVFTGKTVMEDFIPQTSQIISGGISKIKYYLSKLIIIYISFLVFFVTTLAVVYIAGLPVLGWNREGVIYNDYLLKYIISIGMVLIHFLAYSSVFTMLVFICRKSSDVIFYGILYHFIGSFLRLFTPSFIGGNLSSNVMFPYLSDMVRDDRLMTAEFLFKFIPAIIIILISTSIGLIAFYKTYKNCK